MSANPNLLARVARLFGTYKIRAFRSGVHVQKYTPDILGPYAQHQAPGRQEGVEGRAICSRECAAGKVGCLDVQASTSNAPELQSLFMLVSRREGATRGSARLAMRASEWVASTRTLLLHARDTMAVPSVDEEWKMRCAQRTAKWVNVQAKKKRVENKTKRSKQTAHQGLLRSVRYTVGYRV